MPDIFLNFPIKASADRVFKAISHSEGLDNWWTKSSLVNPKMDGIYSLDFGPSFNWRAVVTKFNINDNFELKMTNADADWNGSKVGFSLINQDEYTWVNFYHVDWPEINEHYKISSYCWAMYLRILKRYLEFGELVAYEKRLEV